MTVGYVAYQKLTPATKARVRDLLSYLETIGFDLYLFIVAASGGHLHSLAARLCLSKNGDVLKNLTTVVEGNCCPR